MNHYVNHFFTINRPIMDIDDDDDFQQVQSTAAGCLNRAIRRARLSLSMDSSPSSVADELGARFPFARSQRPSTSQDSSSRSTKRKRGGVWKVVPCAVAGPDVKSVPRKGLLDQLCKRGLGTLWFTKEDSLTIPTYLTPDELHFILMCLYPVLSGIPYEFCKATGGGNQVLVPLDIIDERKKPRRDREFFPYFSPDRVK